MPSPLQHAYDPEFFRQEGHRLVDLLADYQADIGQPGSSEKVLHYVAPNELYQRWAADLATAPNPDLAGFFEKILHDTMHMHHPRYMGHQTSNVAPPAALGEFLSCLLDPGMGVYEQGTSGVALERLLVKEMGKMMHWGDGTEGYLTSGGTLGNLTALLCARAVMVKNDVWEQGYEGRQYAFLVSEEAHYSVARAVQVMGMGKRGVVQVPVNQRFEMRADLLEATMKQAEDEGVTIIGAVASSCSTATGSFDPIADIADFCEARNLWLHVDGAHGGCALFSKKYRHLLHGIERADSMILDFHKMLLTPKLVTAVAFRRGDDSYQTFSQKASYLWDSDEGREWYNLGKRTFELTKSFMSVKLYALWRTYGTAIFEEYVDRQFDLGKAFSQLLAEAGDFEMPVEMAAGNIVCFRYAKQGWSEEKKERVNAAVREQLVQDGDFFIVQTRVKGRLYLRTTLMNPHTDEGHLRGLLERIRALA